MHKVRTLCCLLWKISLVHCIVNTSFPFSLEAREPEREHVGASADLNRTGTDSYPRQWTAHVRCVRTLCGKFENMLLVIANGAIHAFFYKNSVYKSSRLRFCWKNNRRTM